MDDLTRRDAAKLALGAWLATTIGATAETALAVAKLPPMERRKLGTVRCSRSMVTPRAASS